MQNGSYETTYRSWLTLRTEWTSTQNQSTKKSTVVCNHYLINTQSLSINTRNNNICTVGGTSQTFSSPAIRSQGTHFLGTTTHTIQHETDGTKSVEFSTTFKLLATLTGVYVEELTATSGTIELPPIPINSTLTYVSGNPDNDYPTIMVDDITTQINIKYKKDIDSYFNVLKISAVNDGNIKEIKTITESDILSQNCIFSFTQDELNEIWNFTKDVNSGIIIDNTLINLCYLNFELLTYSDSNMEEQIGGISKIVRTARLTVATSKPNLSATLKDVNDKTIALTEDDNVLVRYGSTARVMPTYSANKGAYIKSVTVNGLDLGSYSYLDIVNSSASTYTIVVTDSRGLSTTLVFQSSDSNGDNYFELINYIQLTIKDDSLVRNQPADNKMKLEYSGNYFNGNFSANNANTLEVSYRYKKTTENEDDYSEWISLSPTIEDNKYSQIFISDAIFDYETAFDIEIKAVDRLGEKKITNLKLNKGIPIANWDSEKFNINGRLTVNNQDVTASDTLPIGAIVDYDGDTVPEGYKQVDEQAYIHLYCNGDKSISAGFNDLNFLTNLFSKNISYSSNVITIEKSGLYTITETFHFKRGVNRAFGDIDIIDGGNYAPTSLRTLDTQNMGNNGSSNDPVTTTSFTNFFKTGAKLTIRLYCASDNTLGGETPWIN